MSELIRATSKFIDAYKKLGTDELITEAEKAYAYEQYDLAMEICKEITSDKYSLTARMRALELMSMLYYYHYSVWDMDEKTGKELGGRNLAEYVKSMPLQSMLFIDSRLMLGEYFADNARYKDAISSYEYYMTVRKNADALKGLTEMYKKSQYDTDEQYKKLVEYYNKYYSGKNIKELLQRSAMAGKEYFSNYVKKSVAEEIGVKCGKLSYQYYSAEDYVLPYVLRHYDCFQEIMEYTRNYTPTLEGCMVYISKPTVRLEIEKKTMLAKEQEFRMALERNRLENERKIIELHKQEVENRKEHYFMLEQQMREFNEESKKYHRDMLDSQDKMLKNQEKQMKEERDFRSSVNYKLQRIAWNTDRWM